MFKSAKHIKYLGYDGTTNQYNYEYKIIDTDFEVVVVGNASGDEVEVRVTAMIIDCYTKRNLPVAPNLFRFMLWLKDKFGWPIDEQVKWNKKYNHLWHEVEHDMQMYLMLS